MHPWQGAFQFHNFLDNHESLSSHPRFLKSVVSIENYMIFRNRFFRSSTLASFGFQGVQTLPGTEDPLL